MASRTPVESERHFHDRFVWRDRSRTRELHTGCIVGRDQTSGHHSAFSVKRAPLQEFYPLEPSVSRATSQTFYAPAIPVTLVSTSDTRGVAEDHVHIQAVIVALVTTWIRRTPRLMVCMYLGKGGFSIFRTSSCPLLSIGPCAFRHHGLTESNLL